MKTIKDLFKHIKAMVAEANIEKKDKRTIMAETKKSVAYYADQDGLRLWQGAMVIAAAQRAVKFFEENYNERALLTRRFRIPDWEDNNEQDG